MPFWKFLIAISDKASKIGWSQLEDPLPKGYQIKYLSDQLIAFYCLFR